MAQTTQPEKTYTAYEYSQAVAQGEHNVRWMLADRLRDEAQQNREISLAYAKSKLAEMAVDGTANLQNPEYVEAVKRYVDVLSDIGATERVVSFLQDGYNFSKALTAYMEQQDNRQKRQKIQEEIEQRLRDTDGKSGR